MSARDEEVIRMLAPRAGIEIDGPNPWDIQVHDPRFYGRLLRGGSLGFGESYMDGWWDAERLDETFYHIHSSDVRAHLRSLHTRLAIVRAVLTNPGRRSKAYEIGQRHYDRGNDLFRAMLDRRMIYSCAYWKEARDLDEAQEAKLELICRKLGLKEGDRVLDIGCGWGGLLKFAADRYGARGVGITVSEEQVQLAREVCAGLPIEIRLQDYRQLDEPAAFDHVVSVGMFEHVGHKNYRKFMRLVARQLKRDGLFLLHTIGSNRTDPRSDPWVTKYIFPNSVLPSVAQIGRAAEGLFVVEDLHNLGADYDRTLMAWIDNLSRAWSSLPARYDERFRRMWHYYLCSFAGFFRSRQIQLWQVVLSKRGVPGGYRSVR